MHSIAIEVIAVRRYAISRPAGLRRRAALPRGFGKKLLALLLFAAAAALMLRAGAFLKELASSMAMSDATDIVTMAINDTIKRKMAEGQYDYDYFVSLEKDGEGNVAAITTNMSRINGFAAEVLSDVAEAADSGSLDIRIPAGNLLGLSLTLGRGPKVPVNIIMLTSSYTQFHNELVSSGINQTRHQIILKVVVDIDILIPWDTMSAQVVTDTLIAETVVVGRVPDTYIDMGYSDGY